MEGAEDVGGGQTKVEAEGAIGAQRRTSHNHIQCVRPGVGSVIHDQLSIMPCLWEGG